jgi:hypothetical protein
VLPSVARYVVYARGTQDEITRKHKQCLLVAVERSAFAVEFESDSGDSVDGWERACMLVRAGVADRVLVASRADAPTTVDSVTQELPGPRRADRDWYWRVYSDVLEDLGSVGKSDG